MRTAELNLAADLVIFVGTEGRRKLSWVCLWIAVEALKVMIEKKRIYLHTPSQLHHGPERRRRCGGRGGGQTAKEEGCNNQHC
jgi:hypothetical protein